MKKINKKTSLIVSIVMMAAAAGLLAVSGIGVTRAVLLDPSEHFSAHVEMYDIGVSLTEGGRTVSYRNYDHTVNADGSRNATGTWSLGQEELLSTMVPEGEHFQIGKTYPEELAVANSGSINEFVRVTVYKYWKDKDGNKVTNLDPSLIDVEWNNVGGDWFLASENDETAVLYYTHLLHGSDETGGAVSTSPFTKSLTVYLDDALKNDYTVTTSSDGNTVIYNYTYDGYSFCLEAKVDAVQEHNAEDAILSAWGVNAIVSADGQNLSMVSY